MTTKNKHLAEAQHFLANGRISDVSERGWDTPRIVLADGPDEITLERGTDKQWRYTYASTYGHGHFIWSGDINDTRGGGQYDASGYRITDPDTVAHLEDILRARNIK